MKIHDIYLKRYIILQNIHVYLSIRVMQTKKINGGSRLIRFYRKIVEVPATLQDPRNMHMYAIIAYYFNKPFYIPASNKKGVYRFIVDCL